MKNITKVLTLYKDLVYTLDKSKDITESEYLWQYRCGNKNNSVNPCMDKYLLEGQFLGYALKTPQENSKDSVAIKQGKYLFLQGVLSDSFANSHNLFLQASEELYLESLWLEKKIINDIVFLRFLTEDGKSVFQIFREIEDI